MTEKTITETISYLVENLASSWNGGSNILNKLVGSADRDHRSPYARIRQLGSDGLEQLFSGEESRVEINAAVSQLGAYLSTETWFDRAARKDYRLQSLRRHPVAYFCAEFGLEDWLPIYSGGLGILAGDVIKESSDLGLPFVGVGLFYRRGFSSQKLDENMYQTEIQPTLHPEDLPMTRARDAAGSEISVSVPIAGRTVFAAVWTLQVGRTRIFLLDTDTAKNEREQDRAITASLYGGDHEIRIQQELVLGIGGVRALRALGIDPSIYSMNEGHAAFLGIELVAEMLESVDFATAVERVRHRIVYTNHTVVPAGNDIFADRDVLRYLGAYSAGRGIEENRLLGLAATGLAGQFSMPMLAFRLSGKANAVSHIHAQAVAREWPGFEVEVVTNGVHVPTWLGETFRSLLDQYLPDWRGDSPAWDRVHEIPAAAMWNARNRQRQFMLKFVECRVPGVRLNPYALTVVWARRFAEYKRAGMLASDMDRLERIMSNSDRPVQVVISGKSHPRDEGGKRMMQEMLRRLDSSDNVASHTAFVQDYSIRVAQELTSGADVWLNTPRKFLEASGTSGMKSADNGGLQLTVRDGWADEVDWWDVGWGIEGGGDEADAEQMYQYLEDSIAPCFYSRDELDVPQKWVTMMKNSMAITLSRYSARRMVLEYVYKLYLPLLEKQEAGVSLPSA